MVRFAGIVILFAFFFAMVAPDDMGSSLSSGDDDSARSIYAGRNASPEADQIDQSADTSASTEASLAGQELVISRGDDGQFHLDVDVNGQALSFMVDTGADMVALTVDDARRIGIVVEPQQFRQVGMGAGGAVRGQPIQLETLTVAGHEIGQIDAVVVDGLTQNLLGQSVLRQMGSLQLSGDRMTLN